MNQLILSFLSPRGSIGIGGYWWRQLLLSLPIYPCMFISTASCMHMFPTRCELLPMLLLALAQGNPLTLFSACCGVWDADFAYYGTWKLAMENGELPGWQWMPGLTMLFSYALGILAAWCSFALVLRRLRDTRAGLWALPCCLPLFWGLAAAAIPFDPPRWLGSGLLLSLLLIPLVISLLPSRRIPLST